MAFEFETRIESDLVTEGDHFARLFVWALVSPARVEEIQIQDSSGRAYCLEELSLMDRRQIDAWAKGLVVEVRDFYQSYADYLDEVRADWWLDDLRAGSL